MAHERTERPLTSLPLSLPKTIGQACLNMRVSRSNTTIAMFCRIWAAKPGMLGVIFRKAQNKIQNPALLRRLISDLIDREQWTALDADVKGDAYGGMRR